MEYLLGPSSSRNQKTNGLADLKREIARDRRRNERERQKVMEDAEKKDEFLRRHANNPRVSHDRKISMAQDVVNLKKQNWSLRQQAEKIQQSQNSVAWAENTQRNVKQMQLMNKVAKQTISMAGRSGGIQRVAMETSRNIEAANSVNEVIEDVLEDVNESMMGEEEQQQSEAERYLNAIQLGEVDLPSYIPPSSSQDVNNSNSIKEDASLEERLAALQKM